MLVTSLEHGRAVFKRLWTKMEMRPRWLVIDTETEPRPGYTDSKDALVIGRAQIVVFSICYKGESYSFPTSHFDSDYPTPFDWCKLLKPYAQDPRIIKVFHNANYDLNVFNTAGLSKWVKIWDTMIGAWKANASMEKGLKARGALYGRMLRKTASVSFSNLPELANYAEEDVVLTDEIFQVQYFGALKRDEEIRFLDEAGKEEVIPRGFLPESPDKDMIKDEDLSLREIRELKLQEFPYLRATLRAEQYGFSFDVQRLRKIRKQIAGEKDSLLKKIFKVSKKQFNLNSSKQLIAVFQELGIDIPGRTKKGALSVDAKTLLQMEGSHELVGLIRRFRGLDKLQSVYVGIENPKRSRDRGLEHFVDAGRIHATASTVGTVTGRVSASNPNLTQIPSQKDEFGIKDCFIPPKGYALICLDYAQLELRVGTMYHRDPRMMEVLCDPEGDLHKLTQDEFGVARTPAKNINFLLQFGGGAYMLAQQLTSTGVPTQPDEAKAYYQRYNEVYSGVIYWRRNKLLPEHKKHGYIKLLTGRRRSLPDINWDDHQSVHKAETTLSNNAVQGAGQDFLKASIIRSDPRCILPDEELPKRKTLPALHKARLSDYSRQLRKYRRDLKLARTKWIQQVHDESIWVCEKEAAEDIAQICARIMCMRHFFPQIYPFCVPLVVEGGVGMTWKEAKTSETIKYGFEEEIDV